MSRIVVRRELNAPSDTELYASLAGLAHKVTPLRQLMDIPHG